MLVPVPEYYHFLRHKRERVKYMPQKLPQWHTTLRYHFLCIAQVMFYILFYWFRNQQQQTISRTRSQLYPAKQKKLNCLRKQMLLYRNLWDICCTMKGCQRHIYMQKSGFYLAEKCIRHVVTSTSHHSPMIPYTWNNMENQISGMFLSSFTSSFDC